MTNNLMPDEFLQAYLHAALWSTNDESDPETGGDPMGKNYGLEDISPGTIANMRADCEKFWAENAQHITEESCLRYLGESGIIGRAGHDFWLTRNGHGAGFWDGDWREPEETLLTNACKAYPEVDLYVGDDNKIYD